jgi:hypothetical protein
MLKKNQPSGSNKALVITRHVSVVPGIKSILGNYAINIATDYDSLNSISVIKKSLVETGNTVFIRKSLSRFIGDWGLPLMILLDYRINLGPESVYDSDHRKLLRTFFISFLILMKQQELENVRIHFILLTDDVDLKEAEEFQKNPVTILNVLKSNNEDINSIIDNIKKEPEEFNAIFGIHALPVEGFIERFDCTMKRVVQGAGARTDANQGVDNPRPSSAPAPKQDQELPPTAHLLYRFEDGTAYIDNKLAAAERNKVLSSIRPQQFYIYGRWETRNLAEITELIRQSVLSGIGGRQFKKNDQIVINLSDFCSVDATVISSLVKLFITDFAGFINKTIVVNFKNATILEKGSGYLIIKKYVRHDY